jgi:DNA-binding NarL/FixJ family response regulator
MSLIGGSPWLQPAPSSARCRTEGLQRFPLRTINDAIATILRERLTDQEIAVAVITARGLSTREAASRLCISPRTVEHHLTNIYRKLHIHTRSQLAAAVIDQLVMAVELLTHGSEGAVPRPSILRSPH